MLKKLPIGPIEMAHFSAVLRRISLFQGMSVSDLERLLAVTNLYEYEDGKTVLKKGDVGDALYVVHSGSVRVVKRPFFLWPAKTLAVLGPGEIFGEIALIDQPYRTATVIADGPTQLFVLLNTHFSHLLNANQDLTRDLRQMAKQREFENRND